MNGSDPLHNFFTFVSTKKLDVTDPEAKGQHFQELYMVKRRRNETTFLKKKKKKTHNFVMLYQDQNSLLSRSCSLPVHPPSPCRAIVT